jgi:BRCT domain type II-containing protein
MTQIVENPHVASNNARNLPRPPSFEITTKVVAASESAIASLNRASESAKDSGLKDLHDRVEVAWSEADNALALAWQYVAPESEVAP